MGTEDFKGKKALVTGGTKGIGASIVRALQQAGAQVIYTGRSEPSTTPSQLKFEAVDFAIRADAEDFADRMSREKIDILINNAGINKIARTQDVNLADFDQIQDVNLRAPFALCRAIAPTMAARGYGRILNVASIFGLITRERRISYSTSKAGLIGMTRTLAVDYAPSGVLVNCVCPGFINTELTRRILSPEDQEYLKKSTPMGRLGTPDEIAQLALFLVSGANSFMTGQTIVADGGYTIV